MWEILVKNSGGEWERLDAPQTAISLVFEVGDIKSIKERYASGSYNIKLPKNATNTRLLRFVNSLQVPTQYKLDCMLLRDGQCILGKDTKLYINSIDDNYNVSITNDIKSLSDQLKGIVFKDNPKACGGWPMMSASGSYEYNQITNYAPYVTYSGVNPYNRVNIADSAYPLRWFKYLVPFFYPYYMVKKIIEDLGYTLDDGDTNYLEKNILFAPKDYKFTELAMVRADRDIYTIQNWEYYTGKYVRYAIEKEVIGGHNVIINQKGSYGIYFKLTTYKNAQGVETIPLVNSNTDPFLAINWTNVQGEKTYLSSENATSINQFYNTYLSNLNTWESLPNGLHVINVLWDISQGKWYRLDNDNLNNYTLLMSSAETMGDTDSNFKANTHIYVGMGLTNSQCLEDLQFVVIPKNTTTRTMLYPAEWLGYKNANEIFTAFVNVCGLSVEVEGKKVILHKLNKIGQKTPIILNERKCKVTKIDNSGLKDYALYNTITLGENATRKEQYDKDGTTKYVFAKDIELDGLGLSETKEYIKLDFESIFNHDIPYLAKNDEGQWEEHSLSKVGLLMSESTKVTGESAFDFVYNTYSAFFDAVIKNYKEVTFDALLDNPQKYLYTPVAIDGNKYYITKVNKWEGHDTPCEVTAYLIS